MNFYSTFINYIYICFQLYLPTNYLVIIILLVFTLQHEQWLPITYVYAYTRGKRKQCNSNRMNMNIKTTCSHIRYGLPIKIINKQILLQGNTHDFCLVLYMMATYTSTTLIYASQIFNRLFNFRSSLFQLYKFLPFKSTDAYLCYCVTRFIEIFRRFN